MDSVILLLAVNMFGLKKGEIFLSNDHIRIVAKTLIIRDDDTTSQYSGYTCSLCRGCGRYDSECFPRYPPNEEYSEYKYDYDLFEKNINYNPRNDNKRT